MARTEVVLPVPGRQLHRLPLGWGVGDALLLLDLADDLLHPACHVLRPVRLTGEHPPQLLRHGHLRLVEPAQVAGVHPGHRLAADGPPGQKLPQGGLRLLRLAVDELEDGAQELVPGQKDVAVVEVVGQLEEDGGLHPAPAVPVKAHGQGDLVHDGEADAVALVHQQVGVAPYWW